MKCVIDGRRDITKGQVCPGCLGGLRFRLVEISRLWTVLTGPPDLVPDTSQRVVRDADNRPVLSIESRPRPALTRQGEQIWIDGAPIYHPTPKPRRLRHDDPVAARIPAGLVPGDTGTPRVSGTQEAAMPISADHIDLTLPPNQRPVSEHNQRNLVPVLTTRWATPVGEQPDDIGIMHRYVKILPAPTDDDPGRVETIYITETVAITERVIATDDRGRPILAYAHDQIGLISAPTLLCAWVARWRSDRRRGEGLPKPTVPVLVDWLLARLNDAAGGQQLLREFADEIRGLYLALLDACDETEPIPERCYGVPCKRCDLQTLFRTIDGSGDVECGNCGRLLGQRDYDEWVGLVAADAKQRGKDAEQVQDGVPF